MSIETRMVLVGSVVVVTMGHKYHLTHLSGKRYFPLCDFSLDDKIAPDTHRRMAILSAILNLTFDGTLNWLLALDTPELRKMRQALDEDKPRRRS